MGGPDILLDDGDRTAEKLGSLRKAALEIIELGEAG